MELVLMRVACGVGALLILVVIATAEKLLTEERMPTGFWHPVVEFAKMLMSFLSVVLVVCVIGGVCYAIIQLVAFASTGNWMEWRR